MAKQDQSHFFNPGPTSTAVDWAWSADCVSGVRHTTQHIVCTCVCVIPPDVSAEHTQSSEESVETSTAKWNGADE